LWAVTMHYGDAPAVTRQTDNRRETLTRVTELIGNRGSLAGRRQCISPERYHRYRRTLIIDQ
jgi:hypothetical protein